MRLERAILYINVMIPYALQKNAIEWECLTLYCKAASPSYCRQLAAIKRLCQDTFTLKRTLMANQNLIHFDSDRASDSPFIERVWSSYSERAGPFLSVASSHWEIVISRLQGQPTVTVRGPETIPTEVQCPAEGEWLAIRFKTGTFMPRLPVCQLVNNFGVNLPQVSKRHFLLEDGRWELPTFDNAESFVGRLVNKGLISRDPEVTAVLQDAPASLSTRSAQRRFLQVTGTTHQTMRQIERTRFAVQLLTEGVSIADVVWRCSFYDQAHLTHSLQKWIGLTPTKIARAEIQLSFLYKTERPPFR